MKKKYHIESEEVQRLIAEAKLETMGPRTEVLEHLFRALLQIPSFTLMDGLQGSITPYFAPREEEDGELHCGIDVNFSDGSQLEFTLTNTGWGRPMGPLASFMAGRNGTTPHEQ